MKVLYVCVENSNRSQMAEAFTRMRGGDRVQAYSAGSRPSGTVNQKAIDAMREVGYDLGSHRSKSLEEVPEQSYDFVVTMGCGDDCPWIAARHHEDWALPDPENMTPEAFAAVRDDIERRVLDLLARAGEDA